MLKNPLIILFPLTHSIPLALISVRGTLPQPGLRAQTRRSLKQTRMPMYPPTRAPYAHCALHNLVSVYLKLASMRAHTCGCRFSSQLFPCSRSSFLQHSPHPQFRHNLPTHYFSAFLSLCTKTRIRKLGPSEDLTQCSNEKRTKTGGL